MRLGKICTCYYENKIFFFGGFQKYDSDNTGSFIYCFSFSKKEWTSVKCIMQVRYSGEFPATKPMIPYLGNVSGMSTNIYGHCIIGFGGSQLKTNTIPTSLYSEANVMPTSNLFIYDIHTTIAKNQYIDSNSTYFTMHSSVVDTVNKKLIIYSKGELYDRLIIAKIQANQIPLSDS